VISRGSTRIAFFSDHPPLRKRLERLAAISREMGTPAG
jgi:Zn-dependent protease with chaperone function